MNFLAHLFLSCRDDQLMIGNFLGDLLKRSEVKALPFYLREGVDLHQAIDQFTDNHIAVSAGKKVLYPAYSKYASVVLDIYFDYLLAKNWHLYTDQPLEAFIQGCYKTIKQRMDWIPTRLHPRLNNMIGGRFLHQYISYPGLEQTFQRMQGLLSYPKYFDNPLPPLRDNEEFLNEQFLIFFPDLAAHAELHCKC